MTPRLRAVVEAGGHYIVERPSFANGPCDATGIYLQYGGWAGAGLEWAMRRRDARDPDIAKLVGCFATTARMRVAAANRVLDDLRRKR